MKPIRIEARDGYRLWIQFEDGVQGVIDLTDLSVKPAFARWHEPGFFARATLGAAGEISWPGEIDLCADSIYLRLTGKSPREIFPRLKDPPGDA